MQFYYAEDDQQKGPVDPGQLAAVGVRPDTLVWREGMADWQEAGRVPELAGLFAAAPATPPAEPDAPPPPPAPLPAYAPQYPGEPYGGGYAGYPQPPAYGPPGQPGVAPQLGYAGPGQAPPPPQGLSITSMVLGILAVPTMCLNGIGVPIAILAIVFGHIAQSQHRRVTGRGNGMALTGLICGYASLILVAVLVVIFVVIAAAANTVR